MQPFKPFEIWYCVRISNNPDYVPRDIAEKEFLRWDGMTPSQASKWRWYFRYRQALLQVKYPRYTVELAWGQQDPCIRTEKHRLTNAIRGKKAKITESKNKLQRAIREWDEIFPIEQDPLYPKVLDKIARLEKELVELEQEFLKL